MTSPFKKRVAAGGWFKPADHINDLGIVFEFKKILRDQPGKDFDGNPITRDVAVADLAIFRNVEDVENATPSVVEQGVNIDKTYLVSDVERNEWLGEATIQVIRRPKKAYVFRDPEHPGVVEAATKWYLARQEAEAEVELPDFDEDDD